MNEEYSEKESDEKRLREIEEEKRQLEEYEKEGENSIEAANRVLKINLFDPPNYTGEDRDD